MLINFSKKVIVSGASSECKVSIPLDNGNYKLIKKTNYINATFLKEKLTPSDIENLEHRALGDLSHYDVFSDIRLIGIYEQDTPNLDYMNIEAISEDIQNYIFFNNVLFTGTDCGGGVFIFKHYLDNKLVGFTVTEEPDDFSL